jgi:hypothetical protein
MRATRRAVPRVLLSASVSMTSDSSSACMRPATSSSSAASSAAPPMNSAMLSLA